MIASAAHGVTQVTVRSTSSIASDALTRIPTAHFHTMAWAQEAVAACLEMVSDGIAGDRTGVTAWIGATVGTADVASMISVLSAVCDAVVADAFRNKTDVQQITTLVSALEHEVYAELAAYRERKDADVMNDSDIAELAAGLVRVVRMHDAETAIHLDATGTLGRRIATALRLPEDQISTIELAARLHDIGKVGVRKDVLCKPGPLTAQEWQEMRLHAEVGASVLLDTPKLAHLAPIVRAHHERMDGYGYPDRLRAHEIPIEARVIAVADAFHAMTTERPYRRAMLPNEALEVLAENVGVQFDSDVVAATFELFRYVRRSRRAIA